VLWPTAQVRPWAAGILLCRWGVRDSGPRPPLWKPPFPGCILDERGPLISQAPTLICPPMHLAYREVPVASMLDAVQTLTSVYVKSWAWVFTDCFPWLRVWCRSLGFFCTACRALGSFVCSFVGAFVPGWCALSGPAFLVVSGPAGCRLGAWLGSLLVCLSVLRVTACGCGGCRLLALSSWWVALSEVGL